jgi:Ni,Fe-hydrogenase I cytochrome b subunit
MSIMPWIIAATEKIDPNSIGLTGIQKDANTVLANALSTVYMWAGIICVLVIVIGGYYYTNSSGDSAGVQRAKQAIIGAVVGLVVIIMAFVITQFILGRF